MSEVLLKPIHVKDLQVGYYILIKDVSKEEVLKTNMRNKSLINHSIVENARDGITILNEDDRIIFTNEKFKRITDTNVAFLGVDIASVFAKKHGDRIKAKLAEMKTSNLEFNSMDIKIGEFWFNIRYFPIKDEKGLYNGAALFFIDNTLRMKYREEIEEKNKLLESMNKRLLADIRAGQLLQMSLIPQVLPNDRNVIFESVYILSEQLGGDFYFAEEFKLGRNKYYIAMMSDVSGHGIASSMMTVFVKEIYNEFKNTTESENDFKASRFLNMLNRRLFELNMENQIFITAYCFIIDIARGTVYFSSAGHPHMALIRRDGNIRFCGIEKSPPLGIVEKYNYSDDLEEIEKGDKLVLYTDGLLDVFASSDSYYAYFNNFLVENRQLDIDDFKLKIEKRIFDIIKASRENRDDLTVLLTKIK
jgi:sigma-B regulation protein RsbU (phosphoserine phosphatase)